MTIALIAAMARNRAIGFEGRLPWHISEDLRRFKALTTGFTVIMGRKTYESIGKPLPKRRNIVIGSRPFDGVETFASVEAALAACAQDEKVFIIGGGTIYQQLLARADELYLTIVDGDYPADTFFPEYQQLIGSVFTLAARDQREGFAFEDYVRAGK